MTDETLPVPAPPDPPSFSAPPRRRFAFFNPASGEVRDVAELETDRDPSEFAREGLVIVEVPAEFGPMTHWVDPASREPRAYSAEGSARRRAFMNPGGFRWDPVSELWVDERPIEAVRVAVMEALKRKRDALIEGGFVWDGSPFDSDASISQPRLLGLFTSASMGLLPTQGQPWKLKDNSWRVLTSADAQGVWGAFQSHLSRLFAAFAAHEVVVMQSEDIEFLRNYDTGAGWR